METKPVSKATTKAKAKATLKVSTASNNDTIIKSSQSVKHKSTIAPSTSNVSVLMKVRFRQ